MSAAQKLKFLHYLFEGEAKTFHECLDDSEKNTFEKAKHRINKQFDTNTKQNSVRQYLQSLTLTDIVTKKSCTVNEGLEELRTTIYKFAPEGPLAHRSDEAKIEYMYDAVLEHDWASDFLNS